VGVRAELEAVEWWELYFVQRSLTKEEAPHYAIFSSLLASQSQYFSSLLLDLSIYAIDVMLVCCMNGTHNSLSLVRCYDGDIQLLSLGYSTGT
jgi:hypothetical protein